MNHEKEELKLLLVNTLDITDLLDLLEMDMYDLVEVLDEQGIIEENYETLQQAVQ